ncbi:class I SAM-dependent methyltransferase [Sulfurimonas sp.]|uniref:class I SAM-dependent methyltransferase n=1 Tax=Sulfurimonas sp. TaxID=2022749 RepID=UPI003564A52B
MGLIQTNLDSLGFASLYSQQMDVSTFKGKNSEDWDKRANSMNNNVHNSIYTKTFIDKIDTSDADSLLDVGCGPGTISLAIADKLSNVYALDYSSGMLDCVEKNCEEKKIDNISTINKSWYDDWDEVPNADIVVASRSMEVKDIKDALMKLNSKANKRVYLTTKVGGSFIDNKILNQLSREIYPRPDYIYLVNVLHSMGIYAKVDFIKSENTKFSSSRDDEFVEKVAWSLGELSNDEKEVLKKYYNTTYKFKKTDEYMDWALISWDVKSL